MTTSSRPFLVGLIILDLFLSIVALIHDWSAMMKIPFYLWDFIVICPIFPLLLAFVWLQILINKKADDFLLALAAIPSTIYLIGAIIYYPTWMVVNGFEILHFLQIFWVALYGVQGIYLLIKYPIARFWAGVATVYLLVSFLIQYLTDTYNYLDIVQIGPTVRVVEYIVLAVISIILSYLVSRKSIKI